MKDGSKEGGWVESEKGWREGGRTGGGMKESREGGRDGGGVEEVREGGKDAGRKHGGGERSVGR